MKQLKLFLSVVSITVISVPIIFSCAPIPFKANGTGDTWNAWPITLANDKKNFIADYNGVSNYASPQWNDYTSGTSSQYDVVIRPFNSKTGLDCTFDGSVNLDSQTPMTDGTTPRLNYVAGSGGGSQSWLPLSQDPQSNTAQVCTWDLTDADTSKKLVIGANDDCVVDMDVVHLNSYIQARGMRINWDDTNVINSIKIKFNRNIPNGSAAIGNGSGYWFNRVVKFNYNYRWVNTDVYSIANFPPQESASRSLSLSCTFVVRPNVVQSQIVGPNNLSNWVIDGSGNAQYHKGTDKNCADSYTQELVIPTSVTSLQDYFAYSNTLTGIKKISEASRTTPYTIGTGAFSNKTQLEALSLPNCSAIGNNAFSDCELSDVAIPMVSQIGNQAFAWNANLQIFNGPNVTTLGQNVFQNCTKLKMVELPSLVSYPQDGTALANANIQQIKIGAPSNTPLTYNNLLTNTPIVTSNSGVSNFSVLIPAANAETDPTKVGWAKSYYNPVYGWTNVQTASGHMLPYFFSTYAPA